VILVENLVPGFSTSGGAKHAALRIGPKGMAKRRNENDIGIFGMNNDPANMAGIAEPNVLPALAGVGGLENSVAFHDVAANTGFAGTGEDDVRVRLRDRNVAHRGDLFFVGNRFPRRAAIGGLPNTASHRPEVESGRVAGSARDRQHASGAIGPNRSPGEPLPAIFFLFFCGGGRRRRRAGLAGWLLLLFLLLPLGARLFRRGLLSK